MTAFKASRTQIVAATVLLVATAAAQMMAHSYWLYDQLGWEWLLSEGFDRELTVALFAVGAATVLVLNSRRRWPTAAIVSIVVLLGQANGLLGFLAILIWSIGGFAP